jgi:hypothetical protein
MEVLRLVFLQYWAIVNYDKSFKRHINVIKAQYYYPKKIGPNQTLVPKLLLFLFWKFGSTYVILQINNEKQSCINHGPSLHCEPCDSALNILGFYTSDCTQLAKIFKVVKYFHGWSY